MPSPAVSLSLPFRGTWLFATTYAVDFVAVDGRRTGTTRDWRTVLATEPPERFVGSGQPVLAPAAGTVVSVLDGVADHEARRSQVSLTPYALTQAGRIRGGPAAIAGNHVVLQLADGGAFVLLAHLRRGSVAVTPGMPVAEGPGESEVVEPV